jgi:hypothetical protein
LSQRDEIVGGVSPSGNDHDYLVPGLFGSYRSSGGRFNAFRGRYTRTPKFLNDH